MMLENLKEMLKQPAIHFLLLIAAAAMVRLFYMQVLPNEQYNDFYAERFENREPRIFGDIQDRKGRKIVSQAADITLVADFSKEALSGLTYRQYSECSPEGSSISKKYIFAGKYVYRPGCDVLRSKKAGYGKKPIESFKKDNPWLNFEDKSQCRKVKEMYICPGIDFSDYRHAQNRLEYLFNVYRRIYGLKFAQKDGTLDKLCGSVFDEQSQALRKQLEEITVSQMSLSQYEQDTLSDEDKAMPVLSYCKKQKPDIVEIGLVLSEIYENNRFTPQSLNYLIKEIPAYENKKEDEVIQAVFCDDNKDNKACLGKKPFVMKEIKEEIYSKGYCKGKYGSVLCQKLYAHTLDSIDSFFKKEEIFAADYPEISKKINEAKTSYPHKIAYISKEQIKALSGIYPSWGRKRIADDFIISEDGKIIFDKAKFRSKFMGYYGINRVKNQDSKIMDLSSKAGIPEIAENNYVSLASLPMAQFKAVLPDINYYGGSYSLNGIEFASEENYFSMMPSPYDGISDMLEPYIQLMHNNSNDNVMSLSYKEHGLDEKRGIAVKHIEELKSGKSVSLTIDAGLQQFAEKILHEKCEEMKADRGFLLVQKVNSGEMIAIAEYSADPVISKDGKRGPKAVYCTRNMAECKEYVKWRGGSGFTPLSLGKIYKPGSTFKPFAAAAALEGGFIKPDSMFNVKDEYIALKSSDSVSKAWCGINEHGYKPNDGQCHKDKNDPLSAPGLLPDAYSVSDIIARSSNVGISLIAYQAYKQGKQGYIEEMYKKFGFMSKTGLGEDAYVREELGKRGSMEDKSESELLEDYLKISYGQGSIEITPIELITAYSALVNGGKLYKPYIVKKENKEQLQYEIVISSAASAEARKWMSAVLNPEVKKSTGGRLGLKDAGGKSGTADMAYKRNGENLASFAAFFPNSPDGTAKPEYMVLAIIDENRYGSHEQGAAAAGPLAKKMIEKIRSTVNAAEPEKNAR